MRYIIFTTTLALTVQLSACGNPPDSSDSAASLETVKTEAPQQTEADKRAQEQAALKRQALESPEWVEVETLPNEWAGLYAKNCLMAGPEESRFFNVRDARNSTQYYFSYVVFPPATGHKDEAKVVTVDYKVWQNQAWPDHYLLFGQDSFSQILIENGQSVGQHQTLDGRPWDMLVNLTTKYRATDKSRWAVDLNNSKDYGSGPACDLKLTEPWQDIRFKTKSGKQMSLPAIFQKAGFEP